MELLSNILLVLSATIAGIYCHVLSRRIKKMHDLKDGMGAAISTLAIQVNELNASITVAKKTASQSVQSLEKISGRAELATHRLELLMASMHDIDDTLKKPLEQNSPVMDPFYARAGL